ncbi:MAG: amidohydrolase [Spirochaetia bacterium]|jgi:predicted amidohydrolase YtcJ
MSVDLLLVNGNFHTMDAAVPKARAVASRGGIFVHVGDEAGARAALGRHPEVLDLAGRCVLPGLTDAHLHFKWYAESLRAVNVETATMEEAAARVSARAASSPAGAWITGSGWNHNVWDAGGLPDTRPLDKAAPRNPVCLEAKNGHALWVNSLALHEAGIGLDTRDPEGGQIVHSREGIPSGILLENAMRLVQAAIPRPTPGELAGLMRDAQAAALIAGLTGIHDFDNTIALEAFQELEERGELRLRVLKGIPHEQLSAAISLGLHSGFGGERLTLGPVKMFADGALGPQTAWMIAPYEGTWSTGIPRLTASQLFDDILRANAAGIACAVHAIGDAACHVVLDAFERAAQPGKTAMRNRIEHVQLLHPDDIGRLSRLGITASMQPLHATSDMIIAERYWGERCRGAYAWKSLLDAGATLAFGSDCPVEVCDPLAGIHAAVTRRRADGSPGADGWRPEQRLTVEQAVHAYTRGAAFAAGRESELGSMVAGKRADLTVLDADIFSIDPHEIRNANVAATIIGGTIEYSTF